MSIVLCYGEMAADKPHSSYQPEQDGFSAQNPPQTPPKKRNHPNQKNNPLKKKKNRLKVRDPLREGKKLGPGSCYFQTKALERDSSRESSCLNLSKVGGGCCCFFKLRINKKAPVKLVNFSPVISVTMWSGTLPKLSRNAKQVSRLAE